jgi:hypothetical protein
MSHTFNNKKFKVHYQEYLTNTNEPREALDDIIAQEEISVGLIKNSYYERRKLRRTAEMLRGYSI